jgi:hypothetical protein
VKGIDHLDDLSGDGWIVLNIIVNKWIGTMGTEVI